MIGEQAAVRSREDILSQFPERDLEGHWEISPDADSRWRAAVLEVLLDIRELFAQGIAQQNQDPNRDPQP